MAAKYTPEKFDRLEEIWPLYETTTQVAAAIGEPRARIWHWAEKLSLPRKTRKAITARTIANAMRVQELRQKGIGIHEIATDVGVSVRWAYRLAKVRIEHEKRA